MIGVGGHFREPTVMPSSPCMRCAIARMSHVCTTRTRACVAASATRSSADTPPMTDSGTAALKERLADGPQRSTNAEMNGTVCSPRCCDCIVAWLGCCACMTRTVPARSTPACGTSPQTSPSPVAARWLEGGDD